MTKLRILLTAVLAVSMVAGLSACAPAKLGVSDVTAIIDLRTPDKFATSHITGSINIYFASGSFYSDAGELSRDGKYYLYGETSDEASAASESMRSLGITDLTNLGSFLDAQEILPLGITK